MVVCYCDIYAQILSFVPDGCTNMTSRSHQSNITKLMLLVFFLIVAVSRLPLLGGGFGSDNDSWRNAASALHMRETGHYIASRLPGFPVFEGLLVLLVPLGWVATNLLIALTGAVAALCFLMVARRLRIRGAVWITVAFAFSSVLWVHTTQSMDYAVGLAFLLGAYWALLDRRHLAAGLLLALAAGCRITMGALAAPALVMLLIRKENMRSIITFCASFAVGTAVVFIPVFITLEPQRFAGEASHHASQAHVTLAALPGTLRSGAVYLFGKIGAFALALCLLWEVLVRVRRRISGTHASRVPDGNPEAGKAALFFEIGAILIVGVLFLMIPYESAYLIPLFPFVLLLVGRLLPRHLLAVIAILIMSEVFVMPLFDQRRVVHGYLFQEIEHRRLDLEATRDLAARRPSKPTIFIIGRFAAHRLLVLEPTLQSTDAAWAPFYESGVALWSPDRQTGYAAELNQSDIADLASQGYHIEDHIDTSR